MEYLIFLTTRLMEGLSKVPEGFRQRHGRFLAHRQNPDDGFSGREGESDLYYTAFALRGLAILERLTPEIAHRTAGYLRPFLQQQTGIIDFFSFMYACLLVKTADGPDILVDSPADWPERVAALLETFRTADGGYARLPGAASGSTYHTFLVALCYQLLARPVPRTEEVERFILSRRRDDGGFVEIAPMRRGGTNPTAAAVGLWHIIHGLGAVMPAQELTVKFLVSMQSDEGGFTANARAPLADLLSTFTACWTLESLGQLSAIDVGQTAGYLRSLDIPTGGFRGGLWDDQTDVEYTFYGLGAAALLGQS